MLLSTQTEVFCFLLVEKRLKRVMLFDYEMQAKKKAQ